MPVPIASAAKRILSSSPDTLIMPHYNTKPLFHIHPHLAANEYRKTLMGSVVRYPDNPVEKYTPSKLAKQPRDIVRGLDAMPTDVRNVRFFTHRIRDEYIAALLNEYLDTLFQSSDGEARTNARFWHMESAGEKFQQLLKHKGYSKQLFKLLQHSQGQEGYFITDIVTLVQASEDPYKSRGASKQTIGSTDLPASHYERISQRGVQVEKYGADIHDDETIIFLGYRRVTLEKSAGMMAKLARMFLGQKYGVTVRDRLDYWPPTTLQIIDVPFKTNHDASRTVEVPNRPADECARIAHYLGFNVQIVG